MQIVTPLKIGIAVFFILLYALVYTLTTIDKNERVADILQEQLKVLEHNYIVNTSLFKIISGNVNMLIVNNPTVLELFYRANHAKDQQERAEIRAELYTFVRPHFERLTAAGVNIMLFSFENNKTFLRVHKPGKFDDDLSSVRYSFTYVNAEKKPVFGFEQGKISHAFRNIYPVFYKGEYLGSVDISFSSEALQESLTKLHGLETHFILDKSLFEVNIWKAQKKVNYLQSIEHPDFLFAVTPSHKNDTFTPDKLALVEALQPQINENLKHHKAFSLYRKIDANMMILTFSPIKNIKEQKVVAYLVSYVKSQRLGILLRDYLLINVIAFITLSLLAAVIYNNMMRRFSLQEEVNRKTAELKQLNENLVQEVKRQLADIRAKDNLLMEQSRFASMGEMIGNIAHQWRQPLNAVGLLLQKLPFLQSNNSLTSEVLDETVRKGMELVNKMSTTIDDFRYFLEPVKEPEIFELSKLIESSTGLLSIIFQKSDIKLTIEADPDILINGCKNELSQVFINILNNAKDALVEQQIHDAQIIITAHSDADNAVITIADNAGGIPKAVISRVFDPYFTTKEEGKGTGIGLFMSKRIIEEKMHGTISVKNSNDGALFTITLNAFQERGIEKY